jgi:hypothetical protein
VADEAVGVVQGEIRHLDQPAAGVGGAGHRHRDRHRGGEVDEDREVVRGEVPEDVDVRLEEAEVHPDRIEVIEIPHLAAVDDLLHLAHGARVDERVVDHQHEALPVGQLEQLLALCDRARHRFLDEDVLAARQRALRQLVVRPDGGGDGDRVELRVVEEVADVGGDAQRGIPDLGQMAPIGAHVRAPRDPDPLELDEVADEVRAPVPVADHANVHRRWMPFAQGWMPSAQGGRGKS